MLISRYDLDLDHTSAKLTFGTIPGVKKATAEASKERVKKTRIILLDYLYLEGEGYGFRPCSKSIRLAVVGSKRLTLMSLTHRMNFPIRYMTWRS